MTLALQGIRILDVTDAVSGPFATMLLGSLGAEVIRIDSRRHLGFRDPSGAKKTDPRQPPEVIDIAKVDADQLMGPGFARYNLDKLSVALNLIKPEGREIFKRLVKISDVVVDNLSFGVMHKFGFEYKKLREIKSDIIVASMPSMGHGLFEKWTTWGMNLLSYTGFAHGWGHPDTPMEDRAANSTYGDYIAGTAAASGILAALFHRSRTGEGQYVEVCQAESTVGLLGVTYLDYFVNGRIKPPRGNRHPQYAPYNCYPCKGDDRWCVITVFNENEWKQLCQAMEFPRWSEDVKFATMEARLKNVDELDRNIENWTRQRTPHQVMKLLQQYGVPAGAVQNSEDLYFDLQLRSRGHMIDLYSGPRGVITFDTPPIHLSTGQKDTVDRAPLIGEQNNYVYQELLALTAEEIDRLTKDQIIF